LRLFTSKTKRQDSPLEVLEDIALLEYIHKDESSTWPRQQRGKTVTVIDTATGLEVLIDLRTFIPGPDPVPLTPDFIQYCMDVIDKGFQIYSSHTFVNVTTVVKPLKPLKPLNTSKSAANETAQEANAANAANAVNTVNTVKTAKKTTRRKK
jgi:hypothetical protein